MCHIRHYNKSSNWCPFVWLQAQKLLFSLSVTLSTMVCCRPDHTSKLLLLIHIIYRLWYTVYTLLYMTQNTAVSFFEDYGLWIAIFCYSSEQGC